MRHQKLRIFLGLIFDNSLEIVKYQFFCRSHIKTIIDVWF